MSLYKDASLVMLPSAYKDGKLYSIRPTDGSGDFTFSRGSNLAATRVDVNGLIEKGRENFFTYSNDLSNAAWTKTAGSVSVSKWIPNTANTYHPLGRSTTIQNGSVYAYSLELKADGYDFVLLNIPSGMGTNSGPIIDLSDGTLAGTYNGYNHNAIIESVEDGYYRVKMWFVSTTTSLQVDINPLPTSSVAAYAGDGTSGILVRRIQLEQGLVATDYIETGASTAQAGILEDMPRLDYSGSCPSLLLEPQRTNIITQSEYFSSWSLTYGGAGSAPVVTPNYGTSPEGVANAARVQFDAGGSTASDSSIMRQLLTLPATSHTISVYVKSLSGTANLAFTFNSAAVGTITAVDSEWKRFDYTGTGTGALSTYGVQLKGDVTDQTADILMFAAQVEAGSYPTSYIPCMGTSQTRSADSCLATGVSDLIGQTEGTLFLEFKDEDYSFASISRGLSISDGTYNNRIYISQLGGGNMYVIGATGGTSDLEIQESVPSGRRGTIKAALSYSNNNYVLYVNGSLAGADTSASVPACSNIYLGQEIGLTSNSLNKPYNQVLLFKTRLTNAELAALTTI